MLSAIAAMADLGVGAWIFDLAASVPHGDKIGHVVLAGILSFLLNGTLRCRRSLLLRVRMLTGNLVAYLLVLAEETTQLWMSRRNVDIWDVLWAIVGVQLFGFLAAWDLRLTEARALRTARAGAAGARSGGGE